MYGQMDLIVILVILIIVFGARWIPAAGEAIGRALARRAARRHPVESLPVEPPESLPAKPAADK